MSDSADGEVDYRASFLKACEQLAEANKLLEAERVISHKWYNNATKWSREKAKAKEEGRAEAQARIKVLEAELHLQLVGSCTCCTKTPEHTYHEESCRYRSGMEALSTTSPTEALDKVVREAIEKERQSRMMFIARLNNIKSHGGTTLSVDEVTAILDDCDMLASNAILRIEP